MCYKFDDYQEGQTELGFSIIKELGNIVVGAYTGALAVILKKPIIPSIPTLISGSFKDALNTLLGAYEKDETIYLMEACYEEGSQQAKGKLHFIFTQKTVNEIVGACRKMLDSI